MSRLESLRSLLDVVYPRAEEANQRLRGANGRLFQYLSKTYPVISSTQLSGVLARDQDSSNFGTHFLILKFTGKSSILPLVALEREVNRPADLSIQVAVFRHSANGSPAAIGYRFEAPSGEGRHDYYHVQFVRRFRNPDRPLPQCPEWLPDKQPAIPVGARDAVSLFLVLLISLYGRTYIEGLVREEPKLRNLTANVRGLLGPRGTRPSGERS